MNWLITTPVPNPILAECTTCVKCGQVKYKTEFRCSKREWSTCKSCEKKRDMARRRMAKCVAQSADGR